MSFKKVSLVYTYGLKNAGDMAINLGALDLLEVTNCKIKIFSRFNKKNHEYKKSADYLKKLYNNVEILDSPFVLERDEKLLEQLKNYIKSFFVLTGVIKPDRFINQLTDSDLIIFNGGNLFRGESISDYLRLLALMYPLRVARKFDIPYIIFPQSSSTIDKIGKMLLKNNLQNTSLLYTRENVSYYHLKKYFPQTNIQKGIDLAFFIDIMKHLKKIKYDISNNVGKNKKRIAITLRSHTVGDLKTLCRKKIDKIISIIVKYIQKLHNKNYEIVIVCQTKKDLLISQTIYNNFSQTDSVIMKEEYDPIKLINLYRNCNLIMGMRLHSIIMALSMNTPALGIFDKQWGNKNPGMMEKFELPYFNLNEFDLKNLIIETENILEDEIYLREKIQNIISKDKSNLIKSFNKIVFENHEI